MKHFVGTNWPVDGEKVTISFDAGEIVADALRSFTKELKVRCVLDGASIFRHGTAGVKKYKNVPCVFVDAYDGELWGSCDEYYAISTLSSVINGAVNIEIEDFNRGFSSSNEANKNLDAIQKVLDECSAKCRAAKDKCIRRR